MQEFRSRIYNPDSIGFGGFGCEQSDGHMCTDGSATDDDPIQIRFDLGCVHPASRVTSKSQPSISMVSPSSTGVVSYVSPSTETSTNRMGDRELTRSRPLLRRVHRRSPSPPFQAYRWWSSAHGRHVAGNPSLIERRLRRWRSPLRFHPECVFQPHWHHQSLDSFR